MNHQEQLYIRGFNNGYTIARYEPDLLTKIVKNLKPTTDYLMGFFSGKEEFEVEIIRHHLNSIKLLRDQSIRSQEKEIEKDI